MANDLGMNMLHRSASDMVDFFNYARSFPGSPAAQLVHIYRASYTAMDHCYSRDDFWKWSDLTADCDASLCNAGLLTPDPVNGTL